LKYCFINMKQEEKNIDVKEKKWLVTLLELSLFNSTFSNISVIW
jgi:hypothetical protein